MSRIKKYIENKNEKSLIILAIILVVLIIGIGLTKSDAINISFDNPTILKYADLTSSPYLYCIKEGGSISNTGNTYYADYHVNIKGTTAISESKWGNGSNDNLANAKLAYILASEDFGTSYGYGTSTLNHTPRQEKLWKYWNEWAWNSGKELGMDYSQWSHSTQGEDFSLPTSAVNASISSNVGKSIITDNQTAGPFNVTYTGVISSVIVRDVDGNEIQNDGCYFADENGNTFNGVKDIPSGQNFYMTNYTGKTLKDLTINVDGTGFNYCADMWLLHTNGTGQNLIYATTSKEAAQPASLTIGISPKVTVDPEFNIYINKTALGSSTPLSGAKFKIQVYNGNREKGWLYYDIDEEKYYYKNDYDDATNWYTSTGTNKGYNMYTKSQGKISIKNLNTDYTYKIYEVGAAKNYTLSDQPGHATVKVNNNSSITIKSSDYKDMNEDSKKDSLYCTAVSYSDNNSSSVTINITNYRRSSGGRRRRKRRKLNKILICWRKNMDR